jgi:hypothetical protein
LGICSLFFGQQLCHRGLWRDSPADSVQAILEVSIVVGARDLLLLFGVELLRIAAGESVHAIPEIAVLRDALHGLAFFRIQCRWMAHGELVQTVLKFLLVGGLDGLRGHTQRSDAGH